MQFDKQGYIVSGNSTPEPTAQFPTREDPAIAEMSSMVAALESQTNLILREYSRPNKHQIGHALHMIRALSNDINETSADLYTRYIAAIAAEEEAANEVNHLTQKL